MTTVGYALNGRVDETDGLTYGQRQDLQETLSKKAATKRGKKRNNNMAPDTQDVNDQNQSEQPAGDKLKIQRTVFDLKTFDDVQLIKYVDSPTRPKDVREAHALVGGNEEKLIDLIYKGLVAELRDAEYEKIDGFKVITEDGKLGDDYSGKYADDSKKALINAAVLNIAKLQGYNKDMSADQKKASKAKAMGFIRDNPAMIESIQG